MVRKPIDSERSARNSAGNNKTNDGDGMSATDAPRRIDRLAEVVDRCTDAQRLADALDEKLLSYLLAMAIQETRTAMRSEVAAAAKNVKTAPKHTNRARRPRRAE